MPPVKVGDVIRVRGVRGYGGHGASIKVTKVNKVTVLGIEMERSYSPGTPWRVHLKSEFGICTNPDESIFWGFDLYNNGEFQYHVKM